MNPPPGKWKLIRTHVDAYLLSLLFADLLQGIGAVLSLKWSLEKKTYCSAYCTAQGVIQHLGETGVALGYDWPPGSVFLPGFSLISSLRR